jgi:hypothetical protein
MTDFHDICGLNPVHLLYRNVYIAIALCSKLLHSAIRVDELGNNLPDVRPPQLLKKCRLTTTEIAKNKFPMSNF